MTINSRVQLFLSITPIIDRHYQMAARVTGGLMTPHPKKITNPSVPNRSDQKMICRL